MSQEKIFSNLTPGKGKTAATTGMVAAFAASTCCIPPVIAAIAGIGGISSSLSWMEPFRPYFIGLAVIGIGYAWFVFLKSKKEDDCDCPIDENPKWYQTKAFLVGVSIFASVAIAFPYYSGIFFSNPSPQNIIIVNESNIIEGQLTIEGMTCTGCEHLVNQVLLYSDGVLNATASYETGQATVKFDKSKVSIDELAKSVEIETGYKVIDKR